MDVGERIRQRRKELHLSAEDIAKKLNVDRSTVYRYESNEIGRLHIHNIKPLADILKVTPAYLMGWENEPSSGFTSTYKRIDYSTIEKLPFTVANLLTIEADLLALPDALMGKWARSKDVFVSKVNTEEMNKILPVESLIAVKLSDVKDLKDGDIVLYREGHGNSIRYFYNDKEHGRYIFKANSLTPYFYDHIVDYTKDNNTRIIGKVVVYIVNK